MRAREESRGSGAGHDVAGQGLTAKPLPRRLPLATQAPDLVPARMINETLYCERLMYNAPMRERRSVRPFISPFEAMPLFLSSPFVAET